MIMRTLLIAVGLPGLALALVHDVWRKIHPKPPKKKPPSADPGLWVFIRYFLKHYAGFWLFCLFLIGLMAVFPGRIP
jgi:hypothetical protein